MSNVSKESGQIENALGTMLEVAQATTTPTKIGFWAGLGILFLYLISFRWVGHLARAVLDLMLGRSSKPVNYNDRMQNLIPFLDPDSPRYVEYIWITREGFGLNTISRTYEAVPNSMANYDEMVAMAMEMFPTYYHGDRFFRAHIIDPVNNITNLYLIIERQPTLAAVAIGDKELVDSVIDGYLTKFKPPRSIIINTLTGFDNQGQPVISKDEVIEANQRVAHQHFYPWMGDQTIEEFTNEFLEASENTGMFMGLPGTGKSTLLRTMLFNDNIKGERYIITQQKLLEHPNLSNFLHGMKPNSFLSIEDADNFILARDKGNDQMSMLLNFAEGIVSKNIKIMISTNLSTLKDVDDALLRIGRNHGTYLFGTLTHEEANRARIALDKTPIEDYSNESELTLSKVINWEKHLKRSTHKKEGFGFIN